jgi:heme/copper-type cytochrome/quinol oxidase subunit 3
MSSVGMSSVGMSSVGMSSVGMSSVGMSSVGVSSAPTTTPAPARAAALAREVPTGRRPGWWGMVLALASDVSLFASLVAGYYYVRFVTSPTWPPPGDPLPKLATASIMTGLLVVSVLPLAYADLGLKRGSRPRLVLGALLTALLGAAFVVLETFEWADELTTSWPTKDAYGSFFYAITGFHWVHIALGVLALLMFVVAAPAGRMGRGHHVVIRVFSLYWYTSVVVWVVIYAALYWSVRL